jgi:hypothetical protein
MPIKLSRVHRDDGDAASACRSSAARPTRGPGLKAPLARVGARLGRIFRSSAPGCAASSPSGMLCSAPELGLSDDHSGLMELPADAPVGASLRDYLGLDDAVIEVDLTPNRAIACRFAAWRATCRALTGPSTRPATCRRCRPPSMIGSRSSWKARRTALALHRTGDPRHRRAGRNAAVDGRGAAPQRYSQPRPGGRCHQLRAAGIGPADACFRSGSGFRAGSGCGGRLPESA